MGTPWEGIEHCLHFFIEQRVAPQLCLVRLQLVLGGKLAVDEEVGDFGEGGLVGELFDLVAAVAKLTGLAVDIGDGATTGGGVGKAVVERDLLVVAPEAADVDADIAFRSRNGWEGVLLVVLGQSYFAIGRIEHAFSSRWRVDKTFGVLSAILTTAIPPPPRCT